MTTVFLDTNAVNNPSVNSYLFGRYEQLGELTKLAKLVVPRIVIEEIFQHKLESFEAEKSQLAKSIILRTKFPEFDPRAEQYPFSLNGLIEKQRETLNFEVADFSDADGFMKRFRERALKNGPPFEAETDKGFKDAMVAETIIEYRKAHPEEKIYFLVRDKRLAKFFDDNKEFGVTTFFEYAALMDFLRTEAEKTRASAVTSNMLYNHDFRQREFIESIEAIRDWTTRMQDDLTAAGTVISQPLADLSMSLQSVFGTAKLVYPNLAKITEPWNSVVEEMKRLSEQSKDNYGLLSNPYDIV